MSVSMRFIDGSYDVVVLDSAIGQWPQIEEPEAVVTHFRAFINGRPRDPESAWRTASPSGRRGASIER